MRENILKKEEKRRRKERRKKKRENFTLVVIILQCNILGIRIFAEEIVESCFPGFSVLIHLIHTTRQTGKEDDQVLVQWRAQP
jgi:hypothetical protein